MKCNHLYTVLSSIVLLMLLSACGLQAEPKPSEIPSTSQPSNPPASSQTSPSNTITPDDPQAIDFFDCGILDLPHTQPVSGRENFEEFLNITGVGKSATIQIQQYTIEGHPILSTLSYDGTQYTLTIDRTKDHFSSDQQPKTTTWKRLIIHETSEQDKIYQAFCLTNLDEDNMDTSDEQSVYTLFTEPLSD